MSISGALSYKLELNGSANTCADTSTCRPAFQTCVEVYSSRPNIFVEIYAWRQLRSVRLCEGFWGIVSTIIRETGLSVAIMIIAA